MTLINMSSISRRRKDDERNEEKEGTGVIGNLPSP